MPSPEERREELKGVWEQARACTRCPQLAATRTTVVFGSGNADADLMFVGEAPGANEDRLGLPFVGRAGKLLDTLLGEIGLSRPEVFICNTLKCRPPGNRTPTMEEMQTCIVILREQFKLIRPKLIVTLGSAPTRAILDPKARITRVRGQWFERKGVRIMPTFHPAYLLRNPASKKEAWIDFQAIRDAYREVLAEQERSGEILT